MDDETDEIADRIKRSMDHQEPWRKDAWESFEFRSGRQYTTAELAELEESVRPAITFNRIGPVVESVHGHQINNQTEIKIIPRGIQNDSLAQVYTHAIKWVDDECDASDEISEAFQDAIVCGVGFCEVYMTYDEDPDGKLVSASHIPVLEMGWDPKAKKRNLSDARWIFRRRRWARKDAEKRWPKLRDIVVTGEWDVSPFGEEPHDATRAWQYREQEGASSSYDREKDEIIITQYQYWEHRKIYRIADPSSGRIIELTPKKFERIRESLDAMGARYVQQMKRTYYQCFLAGKNLLEKEELSVNAFTLLAITGKRDNNRNLWQGIVQGMKDPQRWSNKFFAEIQDFMSANRRGGAFAEVDAFENPRIAEEQWNDHGALILLNPGGLGKVQERNAVAYPNGLDRLMQIAIAAIPDTSGINLEMMGLVDRNQPGILEQTRKQSAITILAPFFAALRMFQRTRARLVLHFIKNYLSDGRLIRIVDEGMEQYVPLISDPGHDIQYDVLVDESPISPNQKQETFGVLMNLIPSLIQMGMSVPPSLPKYLPLPKSLVDEWMQAETQKQPDPVEMSRAQKAVSEAKLAEARAVNEQSEAQLNKVKVAKTYAETERTQASIENDQLSTIAKLTT